MSLNKESKTILVTGASGLIGRAVIEMLAQNNGCSIRAQVRDRVQARAVLAPVADLNRIELSEVDFSRATDRNFSDLTSNCDVIIHAAGLAHRTEAPYEEYEVANVRATQHLAEAAAQNKANSFLFLSSSAVYGAGPFINVPETQSPAATTPYAISKLKSETWLQSFRGIPKIVVLRPSLVFGEGDRGNLLRLIKQVKLNRYKHIGAGDTGKSVIYSKDVAKVISLCINRLAPGYHIFNVANPEPVSVKTLTEKIAHCLGMSPNIPSVPEPMLRAAIKAAGLLLQDKSPITMDQLEKLTTTTTCSVENLVRATGFVPNNSLENALRAEIAWANANQLL